MVMKLSDKQGSVWFEFCLTPLLSNVRKKSLKQSKEGMMRELGRLVGRLLNHVKICVLRPLTLGWQFAGS